MSILDGPLVFVDIETNGLDHIRGRIIEVAAVRVEQGRAVRTFNSLIDPETELPWFITNLTGITTNDVKHAPTFHQIATELEDILRGAVFVAHNVRFDYSFLKQEFKRVGQPFLPKQLCTVKLSKALYPLEKSHKLESLIARHGFSFEHRHRAYDDAAVLWQFVQHVREAFGDEVVEAAIAKQIRRPALPKALNTNLINALPTGPGVYIFNDDAGRPLYVGKSVNIKKRVLSHFSRDHDETKEFKIAQAIHDIETRETAGELEALLLESELVKELQPLYNRQLRRVEKLTLARGLMSDDGYMTISLEEADGIDPERLGGILAVYPRRSRAKTALNDIVKTYELCPKLCGLEKTTGACFLSQLHKCHGACTGKELAEAYNARLHTAFERQNIQAWPYSGPVLVQERTAAESATAIVVDQWCVLGTLTQEPYCEPRIATRRKCFDLDTYKILQAYLGQKLSKVTVRPLSDEQLSLIGV